MKKNLFVTEEQIEKLIGSGAKRWQKYDKDRLYLRDLENVIGLQYSRYYSGHIKRATLNGEEISNCACGRILTAIDKAYIDLKENEIVAGGREDAAEIVIDAVEDFLKWGADRTSRAYEIKKKIILNNDSKVFKNWNEFTGITQDDFLEGVKWLCEEERDKKGKSVRTIGCSKDGKIIKLRRIYDRYGELEGYFLYEGTQDGYYKRYRDNVMLDPWDRV